jgi:predicted transcriptional regulator
MNMKVENKSTSYSAKEIQLAVYAKALSHPARIAILQLLIKKQTCICGTIVDELPLSQSTVSQHLKALKDAKLIKGEISGAATCYCVDEKEWNKAKAQLGGLFESTHFVKSKCC